MTVHQWIMGLSRLMNAARNRGFLSELAMMMMMIEIIAILFKCHNISFVAASIAVSCHF